MCRKVYGIERFYTLYTTTCRRTLRLKTKLPHTKKKLGVWALYLNSLCCRRTCMSSPIYHHITIQTSGGQGGTKETTHVLL